MSQIPTYYTSLKRSHWVESRDKWWYQVVRKWLLLTKVIARQSHKISTSENWAGHCVLIFNIFGELFYSILQITFFFTQYLLCAVIFNSLSESQLIYFVIIRAWTTKRDSWYFAWYASRYCVYKLLNCALQFRATHEQYVKVHSLRSRFLSNVNI